MNTRNMNCSECGTGVLHQSHWAADFRHGDTTVRVDDLECFRCDTCGADPVFADQIRRNQLKISDAKRIHDGLLTGGQIRTLRESLGLSQPQAAKVFGGGANAFSKYERGDVMQSVSMDRLLKVADFVPGVIEYLRYEAGMAQLGGWQMVGYVPSREALPAANLQKAGLAGEPVVVRIDAYRERRCA